MIGDGIHEDALQHLVVEWEELPAVLDTETALDAATPLIHPELGDNLCFARTLDTGGVDEAFATAVRTRAPGVLLLKTALTAVAAAAPLLVTAILSWLHSFGSMLPLPVNTLATAEPNTGFELLMVTLKRRFSAAPQLSVTVTSMT